MCSDQLRAEDAELNRRLAPRNNAVVTDPIPLRRIHIQTRSSSGSFSGENKVSTWIMRSLSTSTVLGSVW